MEITKTKIISFAIILIITIIITVIVIIVRLNTNKNPRDLNDKMFPIMHAVDDFMGMVKIKSGKHYTVNNSKRKDASYDCLTTSPFMYVSCPSDSSTTQTYHSETIKERKLEHCK